jgi:2'-5' RNA ligase
MNTQRDSLAAQYARLWDGAVEFVRRGDVRIDPVLAGRAADRRRGLTVLARPAREVQSQVNDFIRLLRGTDPEQYYYDSAELHVTVLSLFTATEEIDRYMAHYDAYQEAVRSALAGALGLGIEFTGVTLTREAVLIQGYPESAALMDTRDALRRELRARGLTEGLDGRYRLETAHMTVVRFRHPPRDSRGYTELLERYRNHPFGRTQVQELHLVRNDWYMSRSVVEGWAIYSLASNPAPPT